MDSLENTIIHVHHGTAYAYKLREDGTLVRVGEASSVGGYLHESDLEDFACKAGEQDEVQIDPLSEAQSRYVGALLTVAREVTPDNFDS